MAQAVAGPSGRATQSSGRASRDGGARGGMSKAGSLGQLINGGSSLPGASDHGGLLLPNGHSGVATIWLEKCSCLAACCLAPAPDDWLVDSRLVTRSPNILVVVSSTVLCDDCQIGVYMRNG